MKLEHAITALRAAIDRGYHVSLHAGIHENRVPNPVCSVEITRGLREVDLEQLLDDFADTPFKPILSVAIKYAVYLVEREP